MLGQYLLAHPTISNPDFLAQYWSVFHQYFTHRCTAEEVTSAVIGCHHYLFVLSQWWQPNIAQVTSFAVCRPMILPITGRCRYLLLELGEKFGSKTRVINFHFNSQALCVLSTFREFMIVGRWVNFQVKAIYFVL